jgi:hypothetical protein
MKTITFSLVIACLGIAHQAHAFCMPGDVQSCFVNGQPGERVCGDDARFGPCIPFGGLTRAASDAACPVDDEAAAPLDRSFAEDGDADGDAASR